MRFVIYGEVHVFAETEYEALEVLGRQLVIVGRGEGAVLVGNQRVRAAEAGIEQADLRVMAVPDEADLRPGVGDA